MVSGSEEMVVVGSGSEEMVVVGSGSEEGVVEKRNGCRYGGYVAARW